LNGATTDDAPLLESRRHQIEQKTQSELNRLKRNYETYLKLSPERRQELARLDDELEQDTKSGGHLQKLLDQYNAWISKLSAFDREKLLATTDPGERAQLVQKILQEQSQRLARASRPPFPLATLRVEGSFDLLSPSDLDAVFTAVEQKFLDDAAKKRVAWKAARDRHLQIVRLTMEQLRRERDDGDNIRPREIALMATVIEAIPNARIKSQLNRRGLPQQTRRQLGQILGRSLLAEWKPELEAARVTPEQIDETTSRWLAHAQADKREAIQQRLQTENGRTLVASLVALQTNPRLKRARQPITWLLRVFPSPPVNRLGRGGALRPADKPSAAKATSGASDPEKDSAEQ
jgi:hypothetical protein